MKGINFTSVLVAVATLLSPIIAAELDPIVIKVSAEWSSKVESLYVDIFGGFRDPNFFTSQTGQNCK